MVYLCLVYLLSSANGESNKCNCDQKNWDDYDEGILRGKDQLPIKKLYYGDSDGPYSWIKYDVGRFQCSGQNSYYPSQRAIKYGIQHLLPVGSVLPWIPKPHDEFESTASYDDFIGWINCDGVEICDDGIFKGETCPDLSGKALIGASKEKSATKHYQASLPDHEHNHSHTTEKHSHTDSGHDHKLE